MAKSKSPDYLNSDLKNMKVETPAAGNIDKFSVSKIAPKRRVNFPGSSVEDNV